MKLKEINSVEEHTLYKVTVKMNESNPEHHAFLFTGFNTGGYCQVYTNNYEAPVRLQDAYSINIIEKLAHIN